MIQTLDQARAYAQRAPSLPANQDRSEVRVYATLITIGLALLLCEPIFYLLTVPDALISRVSQLAYPGPWVVAMVYGVALLGVVPHLGALCFAPRTLGAKWPRRAAGAAAWLAGFMWVYLAWKAYPLDYGLLWVAYAIRGIGSVSIAVAFGVSLNAQGLREVADAPQD